MKLNELKNLIKKILKEENTSGNNKKKTSFNYKSTFEDLVIKTNTAKKNDFESIKKEWLERIEKSGINPTTKKTMIYNINGINTLEKLQSFASYGLLKYEKMAIKEILKEENIRSKWTSNKS
jgi:hypothetical protein